MAKGAHSSGRPKVAPPMPPRLAPFLEREADRVRQEGEARYLLELQQRDAEPTPDRYPPLEWGEADGVGQFLDPAPVELATLEVEQLVEPPVEPLPASRRYSADDPATVDHVLVADPELASQLLEVEERRLLRRTRFAAVLAAVPVATIVVLLGRANGTSHVLAGFLGIACGICALVAILLYAEE